jgi:predicted phage terminase large subunit-like protein
LRAIKFAVQKNQILKSVWPDIFFQQPEREAPKWNEDDGLYINRKTTAKEPTWSAWGLVDSMPTGGHWTNKTYDDLVDLINISTEDQINKVKQAFRMSDNLGDEGAVDDVIGTRYTLNDIYGDLLEAGDYKVFTFPAEVDSKGNPKRGGIPVLMSAERLNKKYKAQGEYIYSSQMLQNPVAESQQGFKPEWIRKSPNYPSPLNKYIIVDPAGSKNKRTDYSVFVVIGTDAHRNYWLVDMVRDKLNLKERWITLKQLEAKHKPLGIGYEKYGMQSDTEYFDLQMADEGLYFYITELSGTASKVDRIKRLVPIFEERKFCLPPALNFTNKNGDTIDLVNVFLEEEFTKFPFSKHDDILDAMCRILDAKMNVVFPKEIKEIQQEDYLAIDPLNLKTNNYDLECSWMGV